MKRRRGFSLVELSIVLVILGLLVGGVLAGQSLIKAAQLRAVSNEYNRYFTAMKSFQDKYFAMPGDMNNATRFWGLDSAGTAPFCYSNSGAASNSNGVCDGDGNGTLGWTIASRNAEMYQFWRELALAGIIEGSYTGITGPANYYNSIAGTNVPLSKYSGGAWAIAVNAGGGGVVSFTPPRAGNAFIIGAADGQWNSTGLLSPEDAWNIDTKLDDGKPGTGAVQSTNANVCVNNPGGSGGTGAANAAGSTYLLTAGSAAACYLEFFNGFQ